MYSKETVERLLSASEEGMMFRFLNLSTGLIVVFAAAAIAVPASAIATEAGSWQNSDKSDSVSLAEPTQSNNGLTPGWNQADTCEWSIEDGTLTLRPLGNGATGKIYQRPSWGTDFVRFVVEGTVTLSGVSDDGDSYHHWDGGYLFSGCEKLETVDLRGMRFEEDSYWNDFSGLFKLNQSEDLPVLKTITIDSSFIYQYYGNQKKPNFPGETDSSRWVSSVDGIAYEYDGYPTGVTATYSLQDAGDSVGVWNQCGSCLWMLDDNGLLSIKPQNGSEGTLSYRFDRHDEYAWLAYSKDIEAVVTSGVVRPYSSEWSGAASGPLFKDCSNLRTADLSCLDTDNGNAHINSNWFEGCLALQSVTLGPAFVFAQDEAPWFPQNSETCRWVSSVDGIAYERDGYPSAVAATYTRQEKKDAIGSWNQCGTCLWLLDESGILTVKPQNGSEGTLGRFMANSDVKGNWLLFPNKIETVVFEDGVKASAFVGGLFQGCSKIKSIDFGSFDTSSAEDMSNMFDGCSSLKHIDLSAFDVSKATSMSWMFRSCCSLESLDLSGFNTSNLEDATGMFSSCSSLRELDLSCLDTSKVEGMSSMFSGCVKLKKLNLSNFSTVSARNMDYMFNDCSSLERLDLSSFDTSSVSDMDCFFGYISSLEEIIIADSFITPAGFCFPERDTNYSELRWKNEAGVEFAPDEVPTGKEGTYTVVKEGSPDNPVNLTRVAGETRYETAEQIARQGAWPIGGAVVLASGSNFPDALAASALAGKENAPVLITESDSLPSSTFSILADLKPSTIYVVGGEAAISSRTASEASSVAGNAEVVRLAGETRYETALAVAAEVGSTSDTVVVATAAGYADALSVSPWAFATSSPVILCDAQEGLSDSAYSLIRENGFEKAVIVGGTSVVPDCVEDQLRGASVDSVQRLSGPTRYETSAKIAEFELSYEGGFKAESMFFATGENYPDALSAGALAGKGLSPLLLVDPGAARASKFIESYRGETGDMTIIGGYNAITYDEERSLVGALGV